MFRIVLACVAGAAMVTPALAGGRVTQIEPRPTYGATVTIEEGVRVFRPLPAGSRHVIVNPNRTPLVLEVGEDGSVSQSSAQSNVVIDRGRY